MGNKTGVSTALLSRRSLMPWIQSGRTQIEIVSEGQGNEGMKSTKPPQ